jgi:protein ImuB
LPLSALPIDDETTCWFVRVGVVTIGDLTRLARNQVAARLGKRAAEIMMLAHGQDPTPLRAYEPSATLCEEASWDEGIEQQSALLFVAKRLTEQLSVRLQGRGQALRALVLSIQLDRAIARLRGVKEVLQTRLEFPAPIDRSEDLLRTIRARLESIDLNAPAIGMRLEAALIVQAARVQLDLSRDVTASPNALPVLLAELAAEIGAEHFGTLSLVDTYRPEARGRLCPVLTTTGHPPPAGTEPGWGASVTRVLPCPLSLGRGRAAVGHIITCGSLPPLEVRNVTFDARLDGIEWWTSTPLHRDYLQAWLQCGSTGATAWIYQDRKTHELKLHGWLD